MERHSVDPRVPPGHGLHRGVVGGGVLEHHHALDHRHQGAHGLDVRFLDGAVPGPSHRCYSRTPVDPSARTLS